MSKRNLYKPAPSQTPPRLSRRSLTQGRLVSTDPRALLDNFSPSAPKASIPTPHTTTPSAKRSLDYHAFSSSTTSDQHPPPYKITPTIVKSPVKVKPSSSLSLSDTEGETKNQTLNNKQESNEPIQPTVLTVDASKRHSSFKDNEVPITTCYVKSPVKVVCHSPIRHISRNVSNEPQYGHAGQMKITVDSVPKLTVLDTRISKSAETLSSSSPPASEGSLSTVAGSPIDRRSKAIEIEVVREQHNPRSYVSFLGDDDSLSGMDKSEIHVKQPKFDDTEISSIAGDSTISSFVDETRKKKRKPRVVQSKYMTSAMSRTGQKSSTIKRTDPRPRVSTTKKTTSAISNQESKKTNIKKVKTKASSRPVSNKDDKMSETNRKEKASKPKFTSTPSEVPTQLATNVNTSEQIPVINPAPEKFHDDSPLLPPSFFTPNKDQSQKKKTVKDLPVSYKETSAEHSGSRRSTKQAHNDKLQLDLQYARLLQWRFLRSKFRHTFEKQEKEAQEQMYAMSQLNEELRKKNCEMKTRIGTKEKLDEVDRQLESQLSLLKSVDCYTSKLFPDYNSLYEGIDTTRHHIVVKDLHLPDNEAELLEALDSCENTLTEITSLLQTDQDKVLSFSEEMGFLAETVQEETIEQDRCIELLAAATTLKTHEESLQAELIQRKEP